MIKGGNRSCRYGAVCFGLIPSIIYIGYYRFPGEADADFEAAIKLIHDMEFDTPFIEEVLSNFLRDFRIASEPEENCTDPLGSA